MNRIKTTMLLGGVALCTIVLHSGAAFAQEESTLVPAPEQVVTEPAVDFDPPNLLPEVSDTTASPDNAVLNVPDTIITPEEAPAPAAEVAADISTPVETPQLDAPQEPLADNIARTTATPATDKNDVDYFYDANALVPEGELARRSPRKVDPSVEPGSRHIIVRKNASEDSRHARLVSASRALTLGRDSSALEIYNELYGKYKKDPDVLMGRAVSLQRLGLVEDAISAYEELLAVKPKDVGARLNMLGLVGERYPEVALRQLKDLRNTSPNHPGVAAQLGIIEARLGNFDSGMRYMGVAASMEPENANHLFNLAVIADQGGYTKDAVKFYEKSLEVDSIYGGGRTIPRDSVYTRLAQIR